MSDDYGFTIDYREPFSREALRAVFTALREAVADNWRLYRDELTTDTLDHPVDVDAWTDAVLSNPMVKVSEEEGGYEHSPLFFHMSWSPVSCCCATVSVSRYPDGTLGLSFFNTDLMFGETLGERELWRLYEEWHSSYVARTGKEPKNVHAPDCLPNDAFPSDDEYLAWSARKDQLQDMPLAYPITQQCLYNVLHHLEKVYPVERVEIDDEIKTGEKGAD
jgi:hypothetical protein